MKNRDKSEGVLRGFSAKGEYVIRPTEIRPYQFRKQ